MLVIRAVQQNSLEKAHRDNWRKKSLKEETLEKNRHGKHKVNINLP